MYNKLLVSVFVVAAVGCATVSFAAGDGQIKFADISESAGVSDHAVNTTGPVFVDYDNDGDVDIYVTTEAHQDGHGNRLWENDGEGGFKNVAVEHGIDDFPGLARGASWGDMDNDGDMDVAISNMPPTRRNRKQQPMNVYQNMLIETGAPDFKLITREAGFLRPGNERDAEVGGITDTGAGVAWGDYNNDGWLDLYWKGPDYDVDNVLFRNNQDGTFTDVTEEAGAGIVGRVLMANSQGSPNWTDIDQDGWIDLLVTNEGNPKVLFRNNGNGTFTDITKARKGPRGFAFVNPGNANGACIGDVDNDGDLDFYLPTADQANRLILSQFADKGKVRFEDVTLKSGAGDLRGARGCTMVDFDNDGYLDIYVNNGGPSDVLINDVITQMPIFVQFYIAWEPDYNVLFRNNGDGTFSDVTDGSGTEGLGIGSGVGAADVNDDGFPDIYVANRTYYNMGERISEADQSYLLLNEGNDNNWLRISLTGTKSNRTAYGARVKIVAGDLVQMREHTSAHGYNSGNDPRLLVGLAGNKQADSIEITWPSGQVQTIENVKANQTLEVTEPE